MAYSALKKRMPAAGLPSLAASTTSLTSPPAQKAWVCVWGGKCAGEREVCDSVGHGQRRRARACRQARARRLVGCGRCCSAAHLVARALQQHCAHGARRVRPLLVHLPQPLHLRGWTRGSGPVTPALHRRQPHAANEALLSPPPGWPRPGPAPTMLVLSELSALGLREARDDRLEGRTAWRARADARSARSAAPVEGDDAQAVLELSKDLRRGARGASA